MLSTASLKILRGGDDVALRRGEGLVAEELLYP